MEVLFMADINKKYTFEIDDGTKPYFFTNKFGEPIGEIHFFRDSRSIFWIAFLDVPDPQICFAILLDALLQHLADLVRGLVGVSEKKNSLSGNGCHRLIDKRPHGV